MRTHARSDRVAALVARWLIRVSLALGVLLVAGRSTPTARAQGPNIDDEVNRIARSLYCPVCPNTPLDVCSTQACAQWRSVIKERLLRGDSEEQIRDYFVTQYGEQVLGAPPPQGFNWLAYILPAIGILLGATIAWYTVRQWLAGHSGRAAPRETPSVSKEYADRIEKDLKEM